MPGHNLCGLPYGPAGTIESQDAVSVACGDGRLIIDPCGGRDNRSLSTAIVAGMTGEELGRAVFVEFGDRDHIAVFNPFAGLSDPSVTDDERMAQVVVVERAIIRHYDLDGRFAKRIKHLENVLLAMSYVPGITLRDLDATLSSVDVLSFVLSFVPAGDVHDRLDRWFGQGGIAELSKETNLHVAGVSRATDTRFSFGWSFPNDLVRHVADGGIAVVSLPKNQPHVCFYPTYLLGEVSAMFGGSGTDDGDLGHGITWGVVDRDGLAELGEDAMLEGLCRMESLRERGLAMGFSATHDAILEQCRRREHLIETCDRKGLLAFCDELRGA